MAEAARLTLDELVSKPALRAYLRNLRNWHGYVRFVGLPDRRDNPDVLIDRLFVEPLLCRRYVSPDEQTSSWIDEAETVLEALQKGRPLVVLGDPGTGKSTLVNFLVWSLARPTEKLWAETMGDWLLPAPMVLRELPLRNVGDFEGLLLAYLNHAVCEPIRHESYLYDMLAEGRVMLLLDGIDEIGDLATRKHLRNAVLEGFDLYPGCRWILSSRIVGYSEVPFDPSRIGSSVEEASHPKAYEATESMLDSGLHQAMHGMRGDELEQQNPFLSDTETVVTRYIAPFDDARIEEFARNWYVQREAASSRAGEDAAHLVKAVHADNAILRLARVPNLLTMMALIHRIEATLPHGRALLYDRIAEAYLESIDRYRGVYSGAYNLPEKKRLLARVGLEMQRRRAPDRRLDVEPQESQLLVGADEVLLWIEDEMALSKGQSSEMSATSFLDYVGRRSGLFLPRSESRYSFVHLSFQEYFAAVALESEVTGVKWARGERTRTGLGREDLILLAQQDTWGETFVFLFELLSSKPDWHEDVLKATFGRRFTRVYAKSSRVKDDTALGSLAQLLARLVVNQRSGLTSRERDGAVRAAVRAALEDEATSVRHQRSLGILQTLLGDNGNLGSDTLRVIAEEAQRLELSALSLRGARVSDIQPLSVATCIRHLDLSDTQVSELQPLARLSKLQHVDLTNTKVSDVTALNGLPDLTSVNAWSSEIVEVDQFSELVKLRFLSVGKTEVLNFDPLSRLVNLKTLVLAKTKLSELSWICSLKGLRSLTVWSTGVACVRDLSNLSELTKLDLWNTKVTEIASLSKLRKLEWLDLGHNDISDFEVLSCLSNLKTLGLTDTEVANLSPLAKLSKLEDLELRDTKVKDVEPLLGLSKLRRLDLRGTGLSSDDVKRIATALPECMISHSATTVLEA